MERLLTLIVMVGPPFRICYTYSNLLVTCSFLLTSKSKILMGDPVIIIQVFDTFLTFLRGEIIFYFPVTMKGLGLLHSGRDETSFGY